MARRLVFKMESHNHPSYIEPYQGCGDRVSAAYLRDVFHHGGPANRGDELRCPLVKNRSSENPLAGVHGVVSEGVGGYGNCFGVPTVGGEVRFHPAYNGNCLVNAFAAGLADADKIFLFGSVGCRHARGVSGRQNGPRRRGRGDHGQSAEFDEDYRGKTSQPFRLVIPSPKSACWKPDAGTDGRLVR